MSKETRATLLYCQLQEGLRYSQMKTPAVSGASDYTELSLAAKNEEKQQAELMRCQQYQSVLPRFEGSRPKSATYSHVSHQLEPRDAEQKPVITHDRPSSSSKDTCRCYLCDGVEHLDRDCRKRAVDNSAKPEQTRFKLRNNHLESTPHHLPLPTCVLRQIQKKGAVLKLSESKTQEVHHNVSEYMSKE